MLTIVALRTARLAIGKLPTVLQLVGKIVVAIGVGLFVLSTLGTHRGP